MDHRLPYFKGGKGMVGLVIIDASIIWWVGGADEGGLEIGTEESRAGAAGNVGPLYILKQKSGRKKSDI